MKRITVTVTPETAAALQTLAAWCNTSHVQRDGANTHGGDMTPARLLAMLAEDAGMVVTRPGCWEAANMAQVLQSHGYQHAGI